MSEEKRNAEKWTQEGRDKGAKYVLDVCDTFSYEHYPVFVMPEDNLEKIKSKYTGANMQTVYSTIEITY